MDHTQTSWFVLHSPELGNAFENFFQLSNNDGILDKKTKELLMLALASVYHSPNLIEEHLRNALDAGATKEEITEVLLVVAAEGAWVQLASAKQMYLKHLGMAGKQ